jgi:predicted lactoylglutathione lyase
MKKIALLMIALLLGVTSVAMADVEATGEGPTKEQALATAKRRAVEQGVGTYLKSSTTVVDSALVDDKILSHSKGYVTSYKELKSSKTEDGFTVTILAKVDSRSIKDDIDALTILRKSVGNPRILVAFSKKGEGAQLFKNKDFVEEIYNGIVETLTDKQFRVVDKASSEKFAQQVATTHEIDVDLNQAAAFGLKYNAEYTLLYSVSGTIKEGAVSKGVMLRIKTQLIDNTRSQVVTNKQVEQTSNAQTVEAALEKAAREGGKKIVNPMIEVVQKNWMDQQQNGSLYTVIIDGVDDPEEIAKFTGMFEKFPLVNDAKEVESGGGKTTFEATYKGKRDQLDRDVVRAAKELGWTVKKVRAEGARSTWKKQ